MKMAQILADVAQRHGIPIADIKSRSRLRPIVHARQEAMALMRDEGRSLTQIGLFLDRDHTSVIWGDRAHRQRNA